MPPFSLSPGGNPEAWARDLRLEDFELLCLDGTRKPVTEAQSCHLAVAPNHAVVSRGEKAEHLKQVLLDQQVWIARASRCLLTAWAAAKGVGPSAVGVTARPEPVFPVPLLEAGADRVCFMPRSCPESQ